MKIAVQRISLVALPLVIALVLAMPVNAMSETEPSEGTSDKPAVQVKKTPEEIQKKIAELRAKSKQKIMEAKSSAKEKPIEARAKACEARAQNLEKRQSQMVVVAEKHKGVFDKIFARAQSFHDTKKLDAEDYDALVAKAADAQTKAADAIVALKGLETDVDCTQVDSLITNLTAFKEGVIEARDSLKEYRMAIKDVLKALSASVDKTTTTSESEGQE